MGRRKIQKKLNKKRIIAKRKPIQRIQKKPTADQSTRMNEMLKVALARQQPNIMTSDPNALAMNKKMGEQEMKTQKQIDALTDRLAQRERELESSQIYTQHQNQIREMKQKGKDLDAKIHQQQQERKQNKLYDKQQTLKRENEQKEAKQEALKKIIESDEFKDPKSEIVKQMAEQERYNMYTQQLEQMHNEQIQNLETRAKITAKNNLIGDIYTNRKKRFTPDFLYLSKGNPVETPLTQAMYYTDVKQYNRPYFIKSNGSHKGAKEPITWDESTDRFKDADGKEVFTYEYEHNRLTDYELFQRDLMKIRAENRRLNRKLQEAEAKNENIEGIRDQISNLEIENEKLMSNINLNTMLANQYYDKEGKPTKKLDEIHKEAANVSHQRAINEQRIELTEEKLEANKAELHEYKQKEYAKQMRDSFDSATFQAQRDEIAEAQNRANYNRIAREETQKDIELQKALLDQQNQKQRRCAAEIRHQGVFLFLHTNQAQAAAKNPDVVNLYGKFKAQFDQLDNPEQIVVERIINKADLDIDTFLHPENYGFNIDIDQYKAANKIAEDVTTWAQNQDPNDLSTMDSEAFIQNYVF